jgi:hypothetical protein
MPTANPLAGIGLMPEYQHVRRALVHRYIGRKPTVREAFALDNAARLIVRSHLASIDASVTADELSKLQCAARRAHEFLAQLSRERPNRLRSTNGTQLLTAFEARP